MIHDNMSISRLMVHAQQVEEARDNRKSRQSKKALSFHGGSLKERLKIKDKPRFKKRFSNQVSSKLPKVRDYRVPNPKP